MFHKKLLSLNLHEYFCHYVINVVSKILQFKERKHQLEEHEIHKKRKKKSGFKKMKN